MNAQEHSRHGAGAAESVFNPRGFQRLAPGAARPGRRQIGLVPGARVAVMALDLPRGLQGAAREKVARRQVADLTGQPPEALDIRPFHGARGGRGWRRVLVADAAEVAAWRAQVGPACRAVLPDYLALPAAAGLWTIAGEGGQVMARLGPEDGFSADAGLAPALIERAWDELPEADRPGAILTLGEDLDGLAEWAAARDLKICHDIKALNAAGLPAPKVLGHGEAAFDLRRDAQAARARLKARVLPWRWPALAGLAAAGLWAAGQILAIDRLDEQRRELAVASTELVRSHFVPEGPILDIRAQVSRALAARQAGGGAEAAQAGPLDLFGTAARVLAEHRAEIGLINYGQAQGLEITAKLADFAALDRLAEGLDRAGLAVTVAQSRTVEGGGAEARLKLAARGPDAATAATGDGETRP